MYPSRKNIHSEILKPKDSVINTDRSKDNQVPITKEQLDTYEKNGFLQLMNIFSEKEVSYMKKAIFELQDANKHVSSEEVIRELESDDIRSFFTFIMMIAILRKWQMTSRF